MWRPTQDVINPAQQRGQVRSVPAPIAGWNTRDALANQTEKDAPVIDNWICRPDQVQTRLGKQNWVTGFANPVNTLMPFNGTSGLKMFAASLNAFYDVTAQGAVGAAVVTGLTSDKWQWVNFATSAGQFLIAVDAADSMESYNGTTWTATATLNITGGGTLAMANVIDLCVYNTTLYMVPKGTTNDLGFYYQAAQSFLGTVTFFNLAAYCPRGGHLVKAATWTVDGGSGPQDYLVLWTSEGELVVFQGLAFSIPLGTPGAMAFVGSYYIGRPIGQRCTLKFGGDLLLMSDRGLFPLSKALQSAVIDRSIALTDRIEPTWVAAVFTTGLSAFGWQMEFHSQQQLLLVNVPLTPIQQFVMQTQTRGWSSFGALSSNWPMNCMLYFNNNLYYGDSNSVQQAYVGNSDNGVAINSTLLPAFSYFGNRGQQKQTTMVRLFLQSKGTITYALQAATDLRIPSTNLAPFTTYSTGGALWGVGLWGVALWSGTIFQFTNWRTPFKIRLGFSFAPFLTMQTSAGQVGLQAYDVLFIPGGVL